MDALSTFLSPDLTTTDFKTGQRRIHKNQHEWALAAAQDL
jgi:hypothetical protein